MNQVATNNAAYSMNIGAPVARKSRVLHPVTEESTQRANATLDMIIEKFHLKNDAALCRALNIAPPVISKIRHGNNPVSLTLAVLISETTGIHLKVIKQHFGFPVATQLIDPIEGFDLTNANLGNHFSKFWEHQWAADGKRYARFEQPLLFEGVRELVHTLKTSGEV